MPTINRERIGFEGASFVREIKVNADSGQFSIALPPQCVAAGMPAEVKADTKARVLREFAEALAEYKKRATTKRRIIAYRFKATCFIWNGERCIHRAEEISFCDGTALSLMAQVFDEHETIASDSQRSYRYEPLESSIPKGLGFKRDNPAPFNSKAENQIPWTPAAEDFFAKIGRSMEDMILAMKSGFQTPETVALLVQSGNFPALK